MEAAQRLLEEQYEAADAVLSGEQAQMDEAQALLSAEHSLSVRTRTMCPTVLDPPSLGRVAVHLSAPARLMQSCSAVGLATESCPRKLHDTCGQLRLPFGASLVALPDEDHQTTCMHCFQGPASSCLRFVLSCSTVCCTCQACAAGHRGSATAPAHLARVLRCGATLLEVRGLLLACCQWVLGFRQPNGHPCYMPLLLTV